MNGQLVGETNNHRDRCTSADMRVNRSRWRPFRSTNSERGMTKEQCHSRSVFRIIQQRDVLWNWHIIARMSGTRTLSHLSGFGTSSLAMAVRGPSSHSATTEPWQPSTVMTLPEECVCFLSLGNSDLTAGASGSFSNREPFYLNSSNHSVLLLIMVVIAGRS
jgi:hypothetical protein